MRILLCDNSPLRFDIDTPYRAPLGGAQVSLALLARGLAKLGHTIVLLNRSGDGRVLDQVKHDHINRFDTYARGAHVVICNRFVPRGIERVKARRFYYAHDAYDRDHLVGSLHRRADDGGPLMRVLCVSHWQRDTFASERGADPALMHVLGNPIDHSLYRPNGARNSHTLIFAGIPYKGLAALPSLYRAITDRAGGASRLPLHVYSSFQLYQQGRVDRRWTTVFRQLSQMDGVYLHAPVSMPVLARELAGASVYVAPSTYHETFGRLHVEALAAGCIPVTLDVGANREIIGAHGCVIPDTTLDRDGAVDRFADAICDTLTGTTQQHRIAAAAAMEQWDYREVAKRFLALV
jgi:glycosyltransferase involved in cell wall biosynthesis